MNRYKKPRREDDYDISDKPEYEDTDEDIIQELPEHGHAMERDPDEPMPYLRKMSKGGLVSDAKSIVSAMRRKKSRQESPEYNDEFDVGPVNEENMSDGDLMLDNEPMGDEQESDEFLADPYGEMTGNAHSSFDPELEKTDRRGRLQKVLDGVRSKHKRMGRDND